MKRVRILLLTLLVLGSMFLSACQPAVVTTEPPPATEPAPTEPPYSTEPILAISGAVNQPLNLSEADLRGLEVISINAGPPGKDPKDYTGVRLNTLLDQAGSVEGSPLLVATASDGFAAEIPFGDVRACTECLVAFGDPGVLNLAMPGMSGKAWVKGVVSLEIIPPPENPALILATTTSTQDSGLLDVLIPIFQTRTGYIVQTVAVGSGQAMTMGQEGNADVLFVHAPASEKKFMEDGYGKDRFLVMHNYFLIVGPAEDPAGIKGKSVVDALAAIANGSAKFTSRGDDSGTHKTELALWKQAGIDPSGQTWYEETGQGMAASLTIASEKGAYILTDRATYLASLANLSLDILVEDDASLLNAYHVITVNPDLWPAVNYEGALAFCEFLVDKSTQELIEEFGVEEYGQPLFYPDAGKTDAELGLP